MSKPQDHLGYEPQQTEACERLLVTLLRNIGPWKDTVTLIGGLVPSLLFASDGHVGTTDIDLVLDLETIAETEAYRTIEQNLKNLGLERGRNEDGDVQHFRWTRKKEGEEPVTIEFLCPTPEGGRPGRIVPLKESGQKRLSAVGISAAHLVLRSRFLNDDQLDGAEKDGPTSYGLFVAPDDPEEQALARQNAVSAIELFMEAASPFL